MRIIKTGTTRTVFQIGNYIFKIPKIHFPVNAWGFRIQVMDGWKSNIVEYKFSKCGCWDGKICPVLFSCLFSLIIVMPKCESISKEEFLNFDFEKFGVDSLERKMDSLGKLNERIVALDYG